MDVSKYLLEISPDPWATLPMDRWKAAVSIRDFMLGSGRLNPNPSETLENLSGQFLQADIPLERCVTIVRILHAESTASVRMWERGKGTQEFVYPHSANDSGVYSTSPSALAHRHKCWVSFNPQELDDKVFGIVPELKEAGVTHYICAPVFLVNDMQNVFTFATTTDGGFSPSDVAFLQATFPAIAACQEILVVHRMLKEVTRMYVGEEPHKRILAGDAHRGSVTHIKSAILFADMRDFTSITAEMTAEEATSLLNDYYDCVVPAIENHNGEVLKFIGDGILAIFRTDNDDAGACASSIDAATAALKSVKERTKSASPSFEIGIALHFGEVAYGNVGSGLRLDYTVIGKDVNLAARVAGLCSTLNQHLLLSQSLCKVLPKQDFVECGFHSLKGFVDKQLIYSMPV